MKWIVIVVAVLLGVPTLVASVGSLLPKAHSASRRATFRQSPETLWRLLTDYAAMPSWRADLRAVARSPDRDGHEVWLETDKRGQRLPLETIAAVPPRRLVRRIADPKLPFGGTWTWEIAAAPGGSTLTITEDGEIYNPIFRFVARFLLGYTGTIESHLKALAAKLGEQVAIE
ncbi:MAG: SRPBCC family protein [Bacillati bacterium ANGP1]|uniref:SRPBCC family protein n=1 Tax=Candidatus Segetimicrobium genomatis TaxID=2569760 RepID=A0A537KG79_9BACT|nr:MAG: SRPBCC family protein [Terrabacteria group bacterium ANGP1]